ncbi:MAG TPA: hypothetical protein VHP55_12555 [Usitatibacter sp.]|jgi:hypothetical protein|nr:hypothetical protein [Usitatibacter sp.]
MAPLRSSILAAFVLFAPCAGAGYEAYDPRALAARATELAAEGRLDAARILLGRAERIAPRDARVARAREAIEARAAGRAAPAEPVAVPPNPTAPRDAPASIPQAPPAAWKLP